jgi:hypothetical protein
MEWAVIYVVVAAAFGLMTLSEQASSKASLLWRVGGVALCAAWPALVVLLLLLMVFRPNTH